LSRPPGTTPLTFEPQGTAAGNPMPTPGTPGYGCCALSCDAEVDESVAHGGVAALELLGKERGPLFWSGLAGRGEAAYRFEDQAFGHQERGGERVGLDLFPVGGEAGGGVAEVHARGGVEDERPARVKLEVSKLVGGGEALPGEGVGGVEADYGSAVVAVEHPGDAAVIEPVLDYLGAGELCEGEDVNGRGLGVGVVEQALGGEVSLPHLGSPWRWSRSRPR